MTEYTAEDFARARVAIKGERESARRTYPGDDMPWLSRNGGRWSDHELAELDWTPVQESQPLTADDITVEMVQRLRDEERALGFAAVSSEEVARSLLAAALSEPPKRPEGAVSLADDMEDCLRDVKLEDVGLDWLADRLAALGYRKVES